MTATLAGWLDRDERSAVISDCGAYRYRLHRRWGDGPSVLFVLLNPSTADGTIDDPTIRRLIGFARNWGYGSLAVGNLFALRATDPRRLHDHADPVGPGNDGHLLGMAAGARLIVAGWGVRGSFMGRSASVRRLIPGMKVLAMTGSGEPKHPLYLRGDLVPTELTDAALGRAKGVE